MTTLEALAANPGWTYGQAVGYVSGHHAALIGDRTAGMSLDDWATAADDYAHGYRAGFQAGSNQRAAMDIFLAGRG